MPRCNKWSNRRSFFGNRFTKQNNEDGISSPRRTDPTPSCSLPRPSKAVPSASKRKLCTNFEQSEQYSSATSNIVLSLDILSSVISQFTACKLCGSELQLHENIDSRKGLACKLVLKCCSIQCNFST